MVDEVADTMLRMIEEGKYGVGTILAKNAGMEEKVDFDLAS